MLLFKYKQSSMIPLNALRVVPTESALTCKSERSDGIQYKPWLNESSVFCWTIVFLLYVKRSHTQKRLKSSSCPSTLGICTTSFVRLSFLKGVLGHREYCWLVLKYPTEFLGRFNILSDVSPYRSMLKDKLNVKRFRSTLNDKSTVKIILIDSSHQESVL